MALKPCRECKTKVSSKAKVCPSCGIPKPVKSGTSLLGIIFLGIIVFVALSPPKKITQQAEPVATIQDAKKQLSAAMKDPRKVRLMECMGVNPWEVKPAGWTPPTEAECNQLKQVLGAESKQRQ